MPVEDTGSKKHPLTPSAKEQEPSSKRQALGEGILEHDLPSTSGSQENESNVTNLSGFQIKKRRYSLASLIDENFEYEIGETNFVSQDEVLHTLGLNNNDRSRLTKAISRVFPGVQLKRRILALGKERENVYYNIKKKSFDLCDDEKQKIVFPENSPVVAIGRLQEEQHVIQDEIDKELEREEHNCNVNSIKLLFERQKKNAKEINKYTDGLNTMYEKEMGKLAESQDRHKISDTLKQDIFSEMEKFKKLLNLGFKTDSEVQIDGSLFSNLSTSLTEECPLLFEVVEQLFLISSGGKVQTGRRINSPSHALALLCSLSSQKITNDFKILFTLLCVSYGAGMRFVEMLNHIGLTVSWKKAMQVLDERMVKMKEHVKKLTPTDIAIIVLMDNINIYNGKRKHLRIFKELTPSMWNFTGRALIIPYVSDDVKKQMQTKDEMCKSQKNVLKIDYKDILYNEKNKEDKVF